MGQCSTVSVSRHDGRLKQLEALILVHVDFNAALVELIKYSEETLDEHRRSSGNQRRLSGP